MQKSAKRSASSRTFGLVFAVLFGILGYFAHSRALGTVFYIVALAFLVLALLVPRTLAPLKRLWLKFGLLLNRIVSPIFLGLIYVLAIIPVGGLARLFGKDLLSLKKDAAAPSYWVKRDAGHATADSLRDQF